MNRFLWSFVAFGALGAACFLAFALIGSSVDEHGLLHEPFILVPIGWLSSFVSGICLLASFASRV